MAAMSVQPGSQRPPLGHHRVTNNAPDQRTGLTLGQLIEFVQDCLRRDIEPAAPIRVVSSPRGRIRTITADEALE